MSRDQRIYFSMDFSKPVRMENRDSTGVAIFSVEKGEPLLVKVALSPVDIDKAKQNMKAEMPGWDFDAAVKAADDAWNRQLGRIVLTDGNDKRKEIFYTAMYHLMTAPSLFCDVDGAYRARTVRCARAHSRTTPPSHYGTPTVRRILS